MKKKCVCVLTRARKFDTLSTVKAKVHWRIRRIMKILIQLDMFDASYNTISRPNCKFRPGDLVYTVDGYCGKVKRIVCGRAYVIFKHETPSGWLPRGAWYDFSELIKDK